MSNQWLPWHSHFPATGRLSYSRLFFFSSIQGPCCNFARSGLTRSNCDWAQSKGCPASESVPAFGPAISFSFPRFAPGPNNFGQKSLGKKEAFWTSLTPAAKRDFTRGKELISSSSFLTAHSSIEPPLGPFTVRLTRPLSAIPS